MRRIVNTKNSNYRDNLARKRRRRFFMWLCLTVGGLAGLGVLLTYTAFFSPMMQITDISVIGLKTIAPQEIQQIIESATNQSVLGFDTFKPYRNILFFNPEPLKAKILAEFPVIQSIEINKEYSHKIIANISERSPVGSWCLPDNSSASCYYFDKEGFLWGKAIKSSGSLLLTVEDRRANQKNNHRADQSFLSGIQKVLHNLQESYVRISRIEIPADSTGEFLVYSTAGYHIIFSIQSDITKQTETLRVFLKDKGPDFEPQYIDVSIEGRAYYK